MQKAIAGRERDVFTWFTHLVCSSASAWRQILFWMRKEIAKHVFLAGTMERYYLGKTTHGRRLLSNNSFHWRCEISFGKIMSSFACRRFLSSQGQTKIDRDECPGMAGIATAAGEMRKELIKFRYIISQALFLTPLWHHRTSNRSASQIKWNKSFSCSSNVAIHYADGRSNP